MENDTLLKSLVYQKCFADPPAPIDSNKLCFIAVIQSFKFFNLVFSADKFCHIVVL